MAEMATSLLEHRQVSDELDRIAAEMARVLEVEGVRIDIGEHAGAGSDAAVSAGGRVVGGIHLDQPLRPGAGARRRLLPGLASLLGLALDRERLQHEALEAEALRRSDAMKTALLRAVSHDLRSPLMTILTSASALDRGDLELAPDDRHELLQAIRSEAGRLDRSSPTCSTCRGCRRARRARSRRSARSTTWSCRRSAEADSERLGVTLGAGSPAVRADAHQIERVLVNLIENALKYSPESEPVRLQVGGTSSEVHVRVIDHGPGIPPSEVERMFEPFQRGAGTTGQRGAGLGLAIARGFAEANGGRIWVESREGQGTTFVLALATESPVRMPA